MMTPMLNNLIYQQNEPAIRNIGSFMTTIVFVCISDGGVLPWMTPREL